MSTFEVLMLAAAISGELGMFFFWYLWRKEMYIAKNMAALADTRSELNVALAHVIVHAREGNASLAMKWDEEAARLIAKEQAQYAEACASLKV